MIIKIEIPENFEDHFNDDRFKDSLMRLKMDAEQASCLAGRYDREVADMLVEAFEDAEVVDDDYCDQEDYCYECGGYGDNYSLDEDGDLVCNCDTCFNNPYRCRDD